jgi:site-specific DNA-methyltransferase (adenine-specific)
MEPIKTMRYLGNKTDMLDMIDSIVTEFQEKLGLTSTLVDAFGGTGSVTHHFNQRGYTVVSNDLNDYAYKLCYSRNNVCADDLVFAGLNMSLPQVLAHLNQCKKKGFVYEEYSPNPSRPYERKYFTNENAERIDGIRSQLEIWHQTQLITEKEFVHLVALLVETTSLYSNIPGTYGAFLQKWDSRALKPLQLTEETHRHLLAAAHTDAHKTYHEDFATIVGQFESSDILYLDPPYNERDYGSYYHVLETISKYDCPELKDNKTGTKKHSQKSNWCVKAKAAKELEYILQHTPAKLVLLSYNAEGFIPPDEIQALFEKYGQYSARQKTVKRFKCNTKTVTDGVVEYIHVLEKRAPVVEGPLSEEDGFLRTAHGTMIRQCCLEGMMSLPAHSVDLICCDLPYGLTECKWDTTIDLDRLWACYTRVLKENGTVLLFGQQPFTSRLVSSNYEMFKYSLVWQKSKPGGFAQAPYKVLCEHEDILLFTRGKTTKNAKNRMTYNPQGTVACNIAMKGKTGATAHRQGRKTQDDYVQTTTNYPRSVLKFNNEGKVKHPTQKPLALIEYLVKTFSNENETVLDNCMGSGTTAVACIKNNRKFVGYETDPTYYDVCVERIHGAIADLRNSPARPEQT